MKSLFLTEKLALGLGDSADKALLLLQSTQFDSQHTHSGSQPPITQVPEKRTPSSELGGPLANEVHIQTRGKHS